MGILEEYLRQWIRDVTWLDNLDDTHWVKVVGITQMDLCNGNLTGKSI